MKKILAVLLATSSVAVFADSFQDFNNNVYAGYNNMSVNQGQFGNMTSWTIGSTIQTKNDIWVNVEANDSVYSQKAYIANNAFGPLGSNYAQALVTGKVGYAFQFFGDNDNGFQVIPYATYTYGTTMTFLNQYYGVGVKPEYRLMNNLKFSLDMTAYDLTQSPSGPVSALGPTEVNPALAGQNQSLGYTQDFRYTLNPEIQYDIAKTILVSAGYKYDQSFNSNTPNSDGNSTVYAKVGYLF
ncbi:MAG: hypothetical protein EKK57_04730 [Proteobacteria bacterium]|nr:MAG: hypothetical protein EKK57_04730 [Pseudomonadota bacterium]